MRVRFALFGALLILLLVAPPSLASFQFDVGISERADVVKVGVQTDRFGAFHSWSNDGSATSPSGFDWHLWRWEKASLSIGALYENEVLQPRVALNLQPVSFINLSVGSSAAGTDYGLTLTSPSLGDKGNVALFLEYRRWANQDGIVMAGVQLGTVRAKRTEPIEGPRYLIINADDLGLSDGVTEGIVQAWRDGVVTSTSALVNLDGAIERIVAAHRANPDMPIGLHLNITLGRPVLPVDKVPTLAGPTGEFYSADEITSKLLSISLDELRAELRAQADLLLEHGIPISHLDYHNHMVVLYAPFYEVVRELAKELNVPVRHPVPESVYGRVKLPGGGGTGDVIWKMVSFGIRHPIMAAKLLPHMTPASMKAQAKLLRDDGIPSPDSFLDVYFGRASVENFIDMLRQLPPGVHEVAVHPAIVDDRLRELSPEYAEARENELAVLLDPRVREAFAIHGVVPVDYAFLQAQSGNPQAEAGANR